MKQLLGKQFDDGFIQGEIVDIDSEAVGVLLDPNHPEAFQCEELDQPIFWVPNGIIKEYFNLA